MTYDLHDSRGSLARRLSLPQVKHTKQVMYTEQVK